LVHHLLRPLAHGGGYEFRHELMREAAEAELLPGERIAVHAAIARWLAGQQATANAGELSRIAHHWCAANDDTQAVAGGELSTPSAFRRLFGKPGFTVITSPIGDLPAARRLPGVACRAVGVRC
jgi:hypothetical protein